MILLIGHYSEPNKERAAEYQECLERNCNLDCISEIIRFIEEEEIPENIFTHPKITNIRLGRRLKFSDCFDYAAYELRGQLCIIANADVYSDDTLKELTYYNMNNKLLAIARWNVQSDRKTTV